MFWSCQPLPSRRTRGSDTRVWQAMLTTTLAISERAATTSVASVEQLTESLVPSNGGGAANGSSRGTRRTKEAAAA